MVLKTNEDGSEVKDFDILKTVMACLVKPAPFATPVLALEIIMDGEWKGIVFEFNKFHVLPVQMQGGFVPTKYETKIHRLPPHLPKDWQPDERFDAYTSEVLFKWLAYINQNSMAPLIEAEPMGGIH